mmetsp:Transcript_55115/g.126609  ORF Transcript_55115/g.126609 Transcript_55115/m.126609 type:complete len:358 (+) Transcript_55115:39-1112(+)
MPLAPIAKKPSRSVKVSENEEAEQTSPKAVRLAEEDLGQRASPKSVRLMSTEEEEEEATGSAPSRREPRQPDAPPTLQSRRSLRTHTGDSKKSSASSFSGKSQRRSANSTGKSPRKSLKNRSATQDIEPETIVEGARSTRMARQTLRETTAVGCTLEEITELKETFDLLDSDGSGSIDPKELKQVMQALGFDAQNETIYQMMSDMDRDGSQSLEFDEFVDMMVSQARVFELNSREEIQEVFSLMDFGNKGCITRPDLLRLASELGDHVTSEEISGMLGLIDGDGDMEVTGDEFVALITEYGQWSSRSGEALALGMDPKAGAASDQDNKEEQIAPIVVVQPQSGQNKEEEVTLFDCIE